MRDSQRLTAPKLSILRNRARLSALAAAPYFMTILALSACGKAPNSISASGAGIAQNGQSIPDDADTFLSPSVDEIKKNPAQARVIHVRLFPLLKSQVGGQDPYLATESATTLEISNLGGLNIVDEAKTVLATLKSSIHLDFRAQKATWSGGTHALSGLKFVPLDSARLTEVLGIKYRSAKTKPLFRGEFHIVPDQRGLQFVNFVLLEDYLRSVVKMEMGDSSGAGAIGAQAIASRTYSLWIMEEARSKKASQGYDILPTTFNQSYIGASDESAVIDSLVKSTSAKILTYNNRIVMAMYGGNSGGLLESGAEGTHSNLHPYFVAKADVAGVRELPDGEQAVKVSNSSLIQILKRFGTKVFVGKNPVATAIKIDKKTESGSASELSIQFKNGSVVSLNSQQTANLLSGKGSLGVGTFIDTASVHTAKPKAGLRLYRLGNAHHLGMCQRGAQLMSKQGASAESILQFYYTGTQIQALE